MEVFNIGKKGKIAIITTFLLVFVVIIGITLAATQRPKQCRDNLDNDNDGRIDYPNDPGCSGLNDPFETSSSLICDNGVDEAHDADILADFRLSGGDPGCSSLINDTSEIDGQCDDLIDNNDRDTYIDFPADLGCIGYSDYSEIDGVCDNNYDEFSDADSLADGVDPGCISFSDTSEIDGECDDRMDNDNDTRIDFPNDLGCLNYTDDDETNCGDGVCEGGETNITCPQDCGLRQCNDNFDNDMDNHIDMDDSKCLDLTDNDESPRDYCNDSDGGINIFVTGIVSGEDYSNPFNITDSCWNNVTVTEYYCSGRSGDYNPLAATRTCLTNSTTICISGRCV